MADIWTNLNTFKLGDVEAANIQRQTDPIHIEELNRQALEDVYLINKASMRDGAAIPDSMKLANTGRIVDSTTTVLFRPAISEIWVCSGAQIDASAGSGSLTSVLNYSDGTNEVRIEAASTAGIAEYNITSTAGPLYVTNDVYLSVTTSSVGAGEECVITGAFMRVR